MRHFESKLLFLKCYDFLKVVGYSLKSYYCFIVSLLGTSTKNSRTSAVEFMHSSIIRELALDEPGSRVLK